MKSRTGIMLILFISLCLSFGCQQSADTGEAKQKAQETPVADVKAPAITVYNPLGTPPPVILKDMAPRLDTINGKTIYIVNDGYPGSGILLGELTAVLKEKYPETTWVFKEKPGGMGSEDPALWKEMEERADAMIIALGH